MSLSPRARQYLKSLLWHVKWGERGCDWDWMWQQDRSWVTEWNGVQGDRLHRANLGAPAQEELLGSSNVRTGVCLDGPLLQTSPPASWKLGERRGAFLMDRGFDQSVEATMLRRCSSSTLGAVTQGSGKVPAGNETGSTNENKSCRCSFTLDLLAILINLWLTPHFKNKHHKTSLM